MNQENIIINPLSRKIKFSLILTLILFILGGLWLPIIYGGVNFDIMGFLKTGLFTVITTWISIAVARFLVFKN